MAVAKEETPAWMRRSGVIAAFHAIIFLHFGMAWVAAAGCLARVIGRRFFGEVEGSPMLSAAASVVCYSLTFAVLLCPAAAKLVSSRGMWSVSKHSKQDALGALKHDSTRAPRTAVLGWVASVPFMLLFFTGSLMEIMSSSPVEGSMSKGEMIGSVIVDVGIFGANAITCFVVIPALALDTWRDDQSDRKAGLTV